MHWLITGIKDVLLVLRKWHACRYKQLIPDINRIVHHFMLDIRYGAFLGGRIETQYSHLGAHDTENTDYLTLEKIFKDKYKIKASDIIVDIGCGKGRVINYILSLGLNNKLIGIEIDEDIAIKTQNRLKKYPNITIISGNAIEKLPSNATLLYMFNPFGADIMEKFKAILEIIYQNKGISVIYLNPVHVNIFYNDDKWSIEETEINGYYSYRFAILQLKVLK